MIDLTLLRDEPELVGAFVATDLSSLLDRLRLLASPLLARLGSIGIAPSIGLADLADWVTRVLVTMVLAPPPTDIGMSLRAVLSPLLAS